MKESTVSVIILGGCLIVAFYLEIPLLAGSSEKQIIEHKTEQTKPIRTDDKKKDKEKFKYYPEYVKTNYACIVKNINETSTDYVSKARKTSSGLEDSIKKYGIEQIVDSRKVAYIGRLDIALERINQKMPDEELNNKTKKIAKRYCRSLKRTNVSTPIDFDREIIIQACQKNMSSDVLFYERLLTSKLKTKEKETDYSELIKSVFSKEEYSEIMSKRLSALDGIYDAFIKSRVGFRGLFAAGSINRMRTFTMQYHKEDAEKIYPTEPEGTGKTR